MTLTIDHDEKVLTWTLGADATGAAQKVSPGDLAIATCQIVKAGAGAATLQVSVDGTNYVTVKDVNGNDVALTGSGLVEFSSNARFIRVVTAADGAATVYVRHGG